MVDDKSKTPSKVEGNQTIEKKSQPESRGQNFVGSDKRGANRGKRNFGNKRGPKTRKRSDKPADDFEQKIVDLARVTRVMAGGKRMKFRATMIIGDKKGKVGVGIAKGVDVSQAISKAVSKARKNMFEVPIIEGTIPHQVNIRQNSANIMIRPAKAGSGIKAGGVVRIVLELAGIKDVVAKILGTNNKINNAKATIEALQSFVPKAVDASRKRSVKVIDNKNEVRKTDNHKPVKKDKINK
ncbi:30S ribosomal protein S5 [Patescibacteria group bacterium]|nr:30S ribosomal protein S5 [Patescibacteria group bacterium]